MAATPAAAAAAAAEEAKQVVNFMAALPVGLAAADVKVSTQQPAPSAPPSAAASKSTSPPSGVLYPGAANISVESRASQVAKYRYPEGKVVEANVVLEDLDLLDKEWLKRLEKAIANEADRTGNWSLLWKAEAMYESLDASIDQLLVKNIKTNADVKRFNEDIGILADEWKDNLELDIRLTAEEIKKGEDFKQEMTMGTSRSAGMSDEDLKKLATLWILRQRVKTLAGRMFEQLSNWTKCDGGIRVPKRRPPVEGFNHLASRIVEWLVWPSLSPGVFQTQRQIMLYGPAGAGKSVISQLAAFDIARAMLWVKIKDKPKMEQDRIVAETDLNDYVTMYFVDAIKLRSDDPETIGMRIRNYLSCLQYEVTRDKSRLKKRKMGLLVLDNIDTLFVSDEELRRQPRAERKSSQLKSWIYKASPEVIAKLGGRSQNAALADVTRVGGQAAAASASSQQGAKSGRSVGDVVGSILAPSALEADFPDVRLIWNARYVWKLPMLLQSYVQQRQLFVDLPNNKTRRSFFESMIRDDLYANLADRIIEESQLIARARDQKASEYLKQYLSDADRKLSEPDVGLYAKEQILRNAVKQKFLQLNAQWKRLPIQPNPGNQLASIVHSDPNLKRLADDYMASAMMNPVLDFVATASGMSLEGYCKLQTEFGLSFSEVDMFLISTGKKADGFAGSTPFGYTLEDMQNLFRFLKASVNQRLLKQAFELKKAFIYGSTRFAANGCKATAADIERKRSESGSAADMMSFTQWKQKEGEEASCQVALGPDLTNIQNGLPVIPLWARFGSHRILKDDAMRALSQFERYVTPKPDYPEFVNYLLYRVPRLNRPLLPPGQISQMCRARPGPAATFLFPASGILTPAATARSVGQLAPWSVLFAPLPRLGGAGGGGEGKGLSGGGLSGGAKKPRRPKRRSSVRHSRPTLLQDADHIPIDALFKRQ